MSYKSDKNFNFAAASDLLFEEKNRQETSSRFVLKLKISQIQQLECALKSQSRKSQNGWYDSKQKAGIILLQKYLKLRGKVQNICQFIFLSSLKNGGYMGVA